MMTKWCLLDGLTCVLLVASVPFINSCWSQMLLAICQASSICCNDLHPHRQRAESCVLVANVATFDSGAPADDEMLAPPPADFMLEMEGGTPAAPPSEPAVGPSPGQSDGFQALADLGPLATPGSIRLAVG